MEVYREKILYSEQVRCVTFGFNMCFDTAQFTVFHFTGPHKIHI